jgi:hypothetical protein
MTEPSGPRVTCSVKSGPAQYLVYSLAGAAAIGALTFVLPLVDTGGSSAAAYVVAYAIVIASVAPFLHGLFLAARGQSTQVLLAVGAAAAALGVLFVFLSRPENGPGLLILANLSRIAAAACLGISLARYVRSVGVILLIAAVAVASDLLSVFAGPTRVLVEEASPVLDFLVVVFPTFGSALGFGLGVSDFVFLALFAAASRFLNLRYVATLICLCAAAFLAVTAGLLLGRPLPALPFVATAFLLANADLILKSLAHRR